MKKLLKTLALLLAMAALFVSCGKKGPDEVESSPYDESPLFSTTDITIDIDDDDVHLSDGNWAAKKVMYFGYTFIEYSEFTVSENGTKLTYTKYIETTYGELSESMTAADVIASGGTVTGNTFKIVEEKSAAELESMSESTNSPDNFLFTFLPNDTIKKNSADTKYYLNGAGSLLGTKMGTIYYIMKL